MHSLGGRSTTTASMSATGKHPHDQSTFGAHTKAQQHYISLPLTTVTRGIYSAGPKILEALWRTRRNGPYKV